MSPTSRVLVPRAGVTPGGPGGPRLRHSGAPEHRERGKGRCGETPGTGLRTGPPPGPEGRSPYGGVSVTDHCSTPSRPPGPADEAAAGGPCVSGAPGLSTVLNSVAATRGRSTLSETVPHPRRRWTDGNRRASPRSYADWRVRSVAPPVVSANVMHRKTVASGEHTVLLGSPALAGPRDHARPTGALLESVGSTGVAPSGASAVNWIRPLVLSGGRLRGAAAAALSRELSLPRSPTG